ncbi:MAG: type II toxin-antitoxin system Phd/YefM family antitoxin [Chloroflexota bacterium]
MADVTIRELRNKGGEVIDRVTAGEVLTVTRDGRPVARLSPLPGPELSVDVILEHWRRLPPMDPDTLRRDIDELIDPSL